MPFALPLPPAADAKGSFTLAALRLERGRPFPILDGERRSPLAAWPASTSSGDNRPDRGVDFAALGLPGVEIRFAPSVADGYVYQAAVRFDLPALDEAFATAQPPPAPKAAAEPDAQQEQPTQTIATALDWPSLAAFWAEQERKHQNARVADSYMTPFFDVDAAADCKVDTLVKGLTWSVKVKVDTQPTVGAPPYGALSIGAEGAKSGNDVLLGCSGAFTPSIASGVLNPGASGAGLNVLGFSPSTFFDETTGALLDNRLTAVAPEQNNALARRVLIPPAANGPRKLRERRLVSAPQPSLFVLRTAAGNEQSFGFWFKDVLFDGLTAQLPEGDGAHFDIWDDPVKLTGGGFEWRLTSVEAADFNEGRSQASLFGFLIEPLQLKSLVLTADDAIASVSILCRVSLRRDPDGADASVNLASLELRRTATGLAAKFVHKDPLLFTFDPPAAQGPVKESTRAKRRVIVAANIVETGTANFAIEPKRLAVEICGVLIEVDASRVACALPDDAAGAVQFVATPAAGLPPPAAGQGRLRLDEATLTVRARPQAGSNYFDLTLTYALEVAPGGDAVYAPGAPADWGRALQFLVRISGDSAFKCFGRDAARPTFEVREGDGAIAMTVSAPFLSGEIGLGFVAHLAPPTVDRRHEVELDFGDCRADLVIEAATAAKGVEISNAHVRLNLSRRRPTAGAAPSPWRGTARLSALVKAKSSINWPSVKWSASSESVPLPGAARVDGRARRGGSASWPVA
ncbi:hypothetical protein [Methylocella sp.]|uniref:hypothetical protein n=1 Tax=Methylocella sp. TaxID=1978226 RepID=UPI0035B3CC0A